MKVLSLKLRGAIGLKKKLGLDEVELNFIKPSFELIAKYKYDNWFQQIWEKLKDAPFDSGIIGLFGKIGYGKTSVLESLTPFRSMASRGGSLYSYFNLKDSYRILTIEYKEEIYECKIFIDALTQNSEAYLYKNGTPLNDGKVTSYDKEVEKIFGSEKIFFNSVFSAQRSSGLAGMEASERRDVFYELLNFTQYAKYLAVVKLFLKGDPDKREELIKSGKSKEEAYEATKGLLEEQVRLENEIKMLKEENSAVTKEQIEQAVFEQQAATHKLQEKQVKYQKVLADIQQFQLSLIKMEARLERNTEVKNEIDKKNSTLETLTQQKITELNTTQQIYEEKLNLFELNNEHVQKLTELEAQKTKITTATFDDIGKLEAEKERLTNEVENGKTAIGESNSKIDRNKKIIANRTKIEEELKKRETVVKAVNELMAKENRIINDKSELQQKEKVELAALTSHKSERQTAEQLTDQKEKEIERLQKDTETIGDVPCTEEVGAGCKFLINAYESKNLLPRLITEHETAKQNYLGLNLKVDLQKRKVNEFADQFAGLDAQLEGIKKKIKIHAGELVEIDKTNWIKLNEELKEADNNLKLLQNCIHNTQILIDDKGKTLENIALQISAQQKTFNERTKEIDSQIISLKELKQKEKERLTAEVEENRRKITRNYDDRINHLTDEINLSKLQLDETLDDQIKQTRSQIEEQQIEITEISSTITSEETAIKEMQEKVIALNAELTASELRKDKAAQKEAELAFVERDIKDYTFLSKAFDKTGIPVLKLENSSVLVTNIANDLLGVFDSKFRVQIETTKLKANKKETKEVFDITVIDEDGACELKYKSGGEKIIIETSIQLALAKVAREQGRHLETFMLDEKDGGMSWSEAPIYLQIVEKSHKENNIFNTFLITHNRDLQEMIPQQVVFGDGFVECRNMN